MDARLDLHKVERLADEVFGAVLQSAKLVARLSGKHNDRQVAVQRIAPQLFHHAKAVETGHFEVQQNQVVGMSVVQGADLLRIKRGADLRVARVAQYEAQHLHIGCLVVHDENAGGEDVLVQCHGVSPPAFNSSQ